MWYKHRIQNSHENADSCVRKDLTGAFPFTSPLSSLEISLAASDTESDLVRTGLLESPSAPRLSVYVLFVPRPMSPFLLLASSVLNVSLGRNGIAVLMPGEVGGLARGTELIE